MGYNFKASGYDPDIFYFVGNEFIKKQKLMKLFKIIAMYIENSDHVKDL